MRPWNERSATEGYEQPYLLSADRPTFSISAGAVANVPSGRRDALDRRPVAHRRDEGRQPLDPSVRWDDGRAGGGRVASLYSTAGTAVPRGHAPGEVSGLHSHLSLAGLPLGATTRYIAQAVVEQPVVAQPCGRIASGGTACDGTASGGTACDGTACGSTALWWHGRLGRAERVCHPAPVRRHTGARGANARKVKFRWRLFQ